MNVKSHYQILENWEMIYCEYHCRNNFTHTKYYFRPRNEQYLDTSENRYGIRWKYWTVLLDEGWRRL